MRHKKWWSGLAAFVAVGAASLSAFVPAGGASVTNGPYFDIGCSTRWNVLVYTETTSSGAPTGAIAALPWSCRDQPDLQNYVRIGPDATFGNLIVREFRTRNTTGQPIGFDVVPGPRR